MRWELKSGISRSLAEKIFICLFLPAVIAMYLIYKYPTWFVAPEQVAETFYFLGMSTSFWYNTLYTGIVCFIAAKILIDNKNPYGRGKKGKLSSYQKKKFATIIVAQFVFFYFLPHIVPRFTMNLGFFQDTYQPLNKDSYVYIYNGFTSWSGFLYLFVLIPISVWFFGKRYCSWWCACGNLAETIGTTLWGGKWVQQQTPRGERSVKLEGMQLGFLIFAFIFGGLLLIDGLKIVSAPDLLTTLRFVQDLIVDLIFGALIGVGAYPFLGTRIWCRYGCPLAQFMLLFGKYSRSKFQVVANDRCRGIGHCSLACPMGIDVASYAHRNKKPIMGSFGLQQTPCIGCGGCIDICPVNALTF